MTINLIILLRLFLTLKQIFTSFTSRRRVRLTLPHSLLSTLLIFHNPQLTNSLLSKLLPLQSFLFSLLHNFHIFFLTSLLPFQFVFLSTLLPFYTSYFPHFLLVLSNPYSFLPCSSSLNGTLLSTLFYQFSFHSFLSFFISTLSFPHFKNFLLCLTILDFLFILVLAMAALP